MHPNPSPVEIRTIPSAEVDANWPALAPFIARALEHGPGTHTLEDARKACQRASRQVWTAEQGGRLLGVLVTEIAVYPSQKRGLMWICAGDTMAVWLPYLPAVEMWLKEQGCQAIDIEGRRGWSRALERHGYEERAVMLSKEL